MDRAPFFFSSGGQQLWGIMHGANADVAPVAGAVAVIAPSLGHEYTRSHRALANLAARLAASGVPALRFDWSGVGDSSGEFQDFGVDRWIGDLGAAIAEARRLSGRGRLLLVGHHWGGAIALMAAAGRGDVESLVLWDMVVNGEAALADMRRVQSYVERSTTARFHGASPGDGAMEAVGSLWSAPQAMGLSRLNAIHVARRPASRVLLVETTERAPVNDVAARLGDLGAAVTRVAEPMPGGPGEDPFKPRVPLSLIQTIASWVAA